MKALIRDKGEIVRESDDIAGIDWQTGAPLTNTYWEGGRPYRLIDGYVESIENETDHVIKTIEITEKAYPPVEEELYELNGKMYTVKELKELLGSL